MKKALFAIIAIGIMALAFLAGCSANHPEYGFNGRIGNESVATWEFGNSFCLEIRKIDDVRITYEDIGKDLKVDVITVHYQDGHRADYQADSISPRVLEVMKEGQKQFDQYLQEIDRINSAPILK